MPQMNHSQSLKSKQFNQQMRQYSPNSLAGIAEQQQHTHSSKSAFRTIDNTAINSPRVVSGFSVFMRDSEATKMKKSINDNEAARKSQSLDQS